MANPEPHNCENLFMDIPEEYGQPLCGMMIYGKYCPFGDLEAATSCCYYLPPPTKEELEAWAQKIKAKNAAMEKLR